MVQKISPHKFRNLLQSVVRRGSNSKRLRTIKILRRHAAVHALRLVSWGVLDTYPVGEVF